jgi:hypothetical protein
MLAQVPKSGAPLDTTARHGVFASDLVPATMLQGCTNKRLNLDHIERLG